MRTWFRCLLGLFAGFTLDRGLLLGFLVRVFHKVLKGLLAVFVRPQLENHRRQPSLCKGQLLSDVVWCEHKCTKALH